MTDKIEVMENIYGENEKIAGRVAASLAAKGVLCVNVMGAPGSGKTSSLIRLIEGLGAEYAAYVIEGDIESDIDTQKLKSLGVEAIQINTHGACHLDAAIIESTVGSMKFKKRGVLFIENIGNLVCPAEFLIGEHLKLLVVSTADGSDKPYKYPLAFEKADAIIINKTDLLPYVDFDREFFVAGVRALNRNAPIFFVSAKTGGDFDEVVKWLRKKAGTI